MKLREQLNRFLPISCDEWLSLILFPFKAYTVVAVIVVFIWRSVLPRNSHSMAGADAGLLVVAGYLLSASVLFICGLIQVFKSSRGSGLVSLAFAGAALIIGLWVASMFAFA